MAKQTKSIIGGMTVLGLTGIICKLIGVLYSVPLTWIIGTRGLGVFQSVFATYNLLLAVSSAGLPVAVSRLVSHHLAKNEPYNAKSIFKVSLQLLTIIGLVLTLAMLACTNKLTELTGAPTASNGFMVIAPCVLIMCILSAFRGYMQGHQNMIPTAISQLIEQVGKVLISLPCAWLGVQQGTTTAAQQIAANNIVGEEAEKLTSSLAAAGGATGALLGITIIEALALLYIVILYLRRRNNDFTGSPIVEEPLEKKHITRQLIIISLPITISACIVPLAQFVDSALMVKRMVASGLAQDIAESYYGIFSGLVIRLINIPTALALSIAMSLVPAISAAMATKDMDTVRSQSNLGLRFAFLIGFPCSVGMSILAPQILMFLYEGKISADEMRVAAELLTISSLTVVLFTVNQAATAILQGLRKQIIPMYTLVAGVSCKIVLNYVLIGTPGIGIHGGPIASLVCYSVAMIPALICVVRYEKIRFNWMGWLVKPGVATAAMGVAVKALTMVLPVSRLCTILEIGVGVAVYVGVALYIGAIDKRDLAPLLRRRKRS